MGQHSHLNSEPQFIQRADVMASRLQPVLLAALCACASSEQQGEAGCEAKPGIYANDGMPLKQTNMDTGEEVPRKSEAYFTFSKADGDPNSLSGISGLNWKNIDNDPDSHEKFSGMAGEEDAFTRFGDGKAGTPIIISEGAYRENKDGGVATGMWHGKIECEGDTPTLVLETEQFIPSQQGHMEKLETIEPVVFELVDKKPF